MQEDHCGLFDSNERPTPPASRRHRKHRKHMEFDRGSESEFHRAIDSYGSFDRTSRLSDGEMARQYVDEIAYLVDKGSYHLGNAAKAAARLIDRIL